MRVLCVLSLLALPATCSPAGNCSAYTQNATNCANKCGSCFNPGSRAGKLCKGEQTGYYCPSDAPPPGSDMAFACMDWTLGSTSMRAAEQAFNTRTQDNVMFGVGTFGTSNDTQRGLGMCLRLRVQGVSKDILAQSVNTGSDVDGNQFDLQVGDGGAGAFNNCAGAAFSMFPGTYAAWGHQYGGVDTRAECAGLPPYPQNAAPMKAANDSLVALCQYSFDQNVRIEGGSNSNPTILQITRVACPEELIHLTQMQRSDDPLFFKPAAAAAASRPIVLLDNENLSRQCGADGTLAFCLTRMMDCRKPSGGFKDNVQGGLMANKRKLVQPCTSDGYTRLDVQCGCYDCYC